MTKMTPSIFIPCTARKFAVEFKSTVTFTGAEFKNFISAMYSTIQRRTISTN